MRTWLTILLLILVPLQLSWAAAARYCQHETGAAAEHFGHHAHEHVEKHSDGKKVNPASSGFDLDCGYCHASCPGMIVLSSAKTMVTGAGAPIERYQARAPQPPRSRLERPNWPLFA